GQGQFPMTPKQQRFIQEYLIDLNATQAAIRAGYSPKTANEQGARLLAKVSIREAIQAAMRERAEKTGISAQWVLDRLRAIVERRDPRQRYGFAEIARLLPAGWPPWPFTLAPDLFQRERIAAHWPAIDRQSPASLPPGHSEPMLHDQARPD